MKLQNAKRTHLRYQKINVNGREYSVDKNIVVTIDAKAHPEDVNKLQALGWTEVDASAPVNVVPEAATPSRRIRPGQPFRGALEFVELLAVDRDLAEQVSKHKSFATVRALAMNMGFKISENDFRNATTQYRQRMAAQALEQRRAEAEASAIEDGGAPDSQTQEPPPPSEPAVDPLAVVEQTAQQADAASARTRGEEIDAARGAKIKPEEEQILIAIADDGAEWPDPAEEMSMPFLRKMAEAYEVTYPADIDKAVLVALIRKEMYDESGATSG